MSKNSVAADLMFFMVNGFDFNFILKIHLNYRLNSLINTKQFLPISVHNTLIHFQTSWPTG
jgi:hypothetical protein